MRCGCENHGPPIKLTAEQCELAIRVGYERQAYHVGKPTKNPLHDEPQDPLRRYIIQMEGAGGEIAASIALGIPAILSTRFEDRSRGDLEDGSEVRTRPEHHNELGLREADREDRRWYLVVGQLPTYWLIGWILGKDGKRPEWYSEKKGWAPTWWVPHWALSKEFDDGRGNGVHQLRLPIR